MMKIMKKSLLLTLKKPFLLLVLIFLLSMTSVFAVCPTTDITAFSTVEGETITLPIPVGVSTTNAKTWKITNGPLFGYDDTIAFTPTNDGCGIRFKLPIKGTYTIEVTDGSHVKTMTVEVGDVFKDRGYGHQCFEINTSNCGDMYVYGDIQVQGSIDAADIYSYGLIHSYNSLRVGDYANPNVLMTADSVTLPKTTITGDLNLLGVLSSSSGLLNLGNTQILGFLNVTDSTYLYKVDTISNNGNPITIEGDADMMGDLFVNNRITAKDATVFGSLLISGGDLTVDNLVVKNNLVVDGDVKVTGSEDRLMGPVNLRPACDSVSPRMYQEGNDFIIEIGDASNKCSSGSDCLTNADCQSGNCNSGVCQ